MSNQQGSASAAIDTCLVNIEDSRHSVHFTNSVVNITVPGTALPRDSLPSTDVTPTGDSSLGCPLPQHDPTDNVASERGEVPIPNNRSGIPSAEEILSSSPDIQLPGVGVTKDQAGSEIKKRVSRCKTALRHLLVALSGVNVLGLRAVIISVMLTEEFEDANAGNIQKLLRAIEMLNGLLPRDGPCELKLSEELTKRIESITQKYQKKKKAIKPPFGEVSVTEMITGFFEELVCEIGNLQLQCSSHTESMAWDALEIAQQDKIKSRLKPVEEAGWRQVQGINECLDDTCSTTLEHIRDWLDGKVPGQIFWLHGMAGTGKSTLARTVCRRVKERCQLGGSFFCSRSIGRTDAKRIIPTLAAQFCRSIGGFGGELLKSNSLKDIGCSPLEQSEPLIIKPLSKLESTSTIVVVFDALDECEGSRALLSAVAQIGSNIPGFRAFITSRSEMEIPNTFDMHPLAQMIHVHCLDSVPRTEVDGDIDKFFRWRLTRMVEENPRAEAEGSWPTPSLIEKLVSISGGSFIFAHTLCEYAEKAKLPCKVAIEDLAWNRPGNHSQTLDQLYGWIITAILDKLGGLRSHPGKNYQAILTTIIFLRTPLSVAALNALLGRPDVFHLIVEFRSILYIPEPNSKDVVRVIHPSLQDLLANSQRLSRAGFGHLIDQSAHNRTFVEQLWKLMADNLCCSSPSIKDPNIRDGAVAYACCFWAEHLKLVGTDPAEDAEDFLNEPSQLGDADRKSILALQDFISNKLLNWVEALVILERLDVCVSALVIAQDWCKSRVSFRQPTNIRKLICQLSDAHRLVLEFYECIEKDPSQIYTSSLPFIPTTSPLRETFLMPAGNSINIVTPNTQWKPALRTMQTGRDNDLIRQVVISPAGPIIATVVGPYGDRIICAWDATTGHKKWTHPLDGSDQEEMYLFLIDRDCQCVLELPSEKKVLFFNTENGAVTKKTEGFVARIMPNGFPSLVIDSDRLSKGVAPRHFDRRPDRIYWPLQDEKAARAVSNLDDFHNNCPTSHTLSECGSFLIYGTKNHCVEVWSYKHGPSSTRLKSQVGGCILCVACSPDAKYIAGGAGNVIEIWNRGLGELVSTLRGHDRQVNSIVFSRDGQQLISGSDDGTVKIWYWGLAQGQKEIGHTLRVTSLSFLPDDSDGDTLMSTSLDGTTFAWSISSLPSPHSTDVSLRIRRNFLPKDQLKTLTGAAGAISRDGELFVMGRMWRPESSCPKLLAEWGMCMWRLKSHDRPSIPIRIPRRCGFVSCDCLALSKDGTLFAWAGISAGVPSMRGPPIYSVEIYSTHSTKLFERITIKACYGYDVHSNNVKIAFSDHGTLLISGFGFIYFVHQLGKKKEGAMSTQTAEAKGWSLIRRSVMHRFSECKIKFECEEYLRDTPHDLFVSGDHFILVTGKGKQEKRERLRWQILPNGKETLERVNDMGHAFFMHRGWIKDAGSDFTCWVPPMYRGRDCYGVSGNRMALGGEDGSIMVIELPSRT